MENTQSNAIISLLKTAKERNASDLHFAAGIRPMFRVDGTLVPASEKTVDVSEIESLLDTLLNERQREKLQKNGEAEISRSIEDICRVRVGVFLQRGTYAITIRLLPFLIPSGEEIGIPGTILALAEKKSGLILIAGTAGSGKTTTVASIVSAVTRTASKAVIAIERPIEYLYQPKDSVICQREVGADSISYVSALTAALRQDADIITIGELKEPEAVLAAFTAAETGHLVLATLHTDRASGIADRLADLFPFAQQPKVRQRLAHVLLGASAQQLLPRREGGGRIAAFEVMTMTPLIKNLICDGKSSQIPAAIQAGIKDGMQSMDDAIYELYMKSRITAETAVRYAHDTDAMQQKV